MIYIISYHGKNSVGGVERVVEYLEEVLLSANEAVTIVDKTCLQQMCLAHWLYQLLPIKLWQVLVPWLMGLYLRKRVKPGDKVINNGYNMLGFPADLLIAHGSMRGLSTR